MKTCSKCKVEKTPGEFSKDKSRKDGLQPRCKACQKANYQANKHKYLKQQKDRRDADPDKFRKIARDRYHANPEPQKIRSIEWRKANPEKSRERTRRWADANPEAVRESHRRYRLANPDKRRQDVNTRRARKRNAAGSATAQDIQNRLDAHGNKCIFCGSTEDLHLDHIKPLSKGGSNWPSNLAPACGSCNISKHAKWGPDLVAWGTEKFGPDRVKSWPFL